MSASLRSFDHVQLAMPVGGEDAARAFWIGLLGFTEQPKPPALAARGGAWFDGGAVIIHVGAESPFVPARKAHPAFRVSAIDALAQRFNDAGHPVRWDTEIPDVRRFHVDDPFGNRLECVGDGT